MKRIKEYIKLGNKDEEVTEVVETEEKEEKEMGFFAKHKKGLIIGSVVGLLAGGAALLLKKGSDDDSEEDLLDFDIFDEDGDSEASEDSNEE